MGKTKRFIFLAGFCALALILAVGAGSVNVSPMDTVRVIAGKLFGFGGGGVDPAVEAILWKIRLPRALLAFLAGSGLAVSGVVMQSILRNPLASSYTLGVSAGAALGATVAIALKWSFLGIMTLPVFGAASGMLTVFLALGAASRVDRNMQNNSIILTGMALSLFADAMITVVMALSREQLHRLVFWQMGSFSMKTAGYPLALFPFVIAGTLIAMSRSRELDIMTLGDEQAQVSGVGVKRLKIFMIILGTLLTGVVVSMVGIIGFIDLFTPHAARKVFGANHRRVIPASALMGGAFMVLCDLAARTVAAPVELPVGAVTSAIGAPFFIYLYFSGRKKKSP